MELPSGQVEIPLTDESVRYRKFLDSIYNHTLLDELTTQFRANFNPRITDFLRSLDITSGFVALPVGSFHSLVDSQSDYDSVIFFDQHTRTKWSQIPSLNEKLKASKVDVVGLGHYFNRWNYSRGDVVDLGYALLTCPDEFAAGDINALRQLRMTVVDVLSSEGVWQYIEQRFNANVAHWHDDTSPFAMIPNKGIKGPDRVSRIDRVKAAAAHMGVDYSEWVGFREHLTFPPSEVAIAAVKATSGKLAL